MITPEARTRELIDQKLAQAGWLVQGMKQFNLGAALEVAVRGCRPDTGFADHVLFVNHAVEVSLKQASAQHKNILKAAFSGQLVPQDPNDEPASVLLERIRAERAAQNKQPKPRKTHVVREAA